MGTKMKISLAELGIKEATQQFLKEMNYRDAETLYCGMIGDWSPFKLWFDELLGEDYDAVMKTLKEKLPAEVINRAHEAPFKLPPTGTWKA